MFSLVHQRCWGWDCRCHTHASDFVGCSHLYPRWGCGPWLFTLASCSPFFPWARQWMETGAEWSSTGARAPPFSQGRQQRNAQVQRALRAGCRLPGPLGKRQRDCFLQQCPGQAMPWACGWGSAVLSHLAGWGAAQGALNKAPGMGAVGRSRGPVHMGHLSYPCYQAELCLPPTWCQLPSAPGSPPLRPRGSYLPLIPILVPPCVAMSCSGWGSGRPGHPGSSCSVTCGGGTAATGGAPAQGPSSGGAACQGPTG